MKSKLVRIAAEADEALKQDDLAAADRAADALLPHSRSAGLAYKGVVALRRDLYHLAEEYLLESFQLSPRQHLALANLLPTYIKKGEYKKAVAFGEQAYAAMPDNQGVALNYVAALLNQQDFTRALEILLPRLDRDKPNVTVLSGLISCYRSLFMTNEAEELLALADQHFGDRGEIMRLRADTLAERSPTEALKSFEAALEKNPNSIATRWNMSLVQLRLGHYREGWANYDYGLLPEVGKIGRPLPKVFQGVHRIVDVDRLDPAKWTFVVCEQGIGDQVLFLGVLKYFLQSFPKTALIAEKRMHSILGRSFPGLPIYPYGAGPLLASNSSISNGIVPVGSLQKKYRSSRAGFLAHREPYLVPDASKVAELRDILLHKTGARKIVGFSWKGGYWERAQKTKTLDIELWEPIFCHEDVIFVSLQYGDVAKEKAYVDGRFLNVRWIDGLDFKKDLESWLALACACDDIISVSTAIVHFAGAAGRSVHLLLSDRGAPFVWGVEGDRSIAYPDIHIHRKQPGQPNAEFFEDVAAAVLPIEEAVQ